MSRGVALLILNLDARWRWVVRPISRPIYPRGRATVVSSAIDVD